MLKMFIFGLFICLNIISSFLGHGLVEIGPFVVPAAVVVYFWTFLLSDFYCEFFGKTESSKMVLLSVIISISGLFLMSFAFLLKPALFAITRMVELKNVALGGIRIMGASVLAFFISQYVDVHIFHFLKKKTKSKKRWLRNNFSTMTSQLIDTIIFIFIAFWGVVPNIFQLVVSQYVVKLFLAILDTPFFYLGTSLYKKIKK